MSLPDSTTVLIVGAGPAGLAAALSLHHYGVRDFIIVDAVAQGQNVSRAIAVHAATLEALDITGCGDDIASHGTKYASFSIGTRSSKLCSPHVDSLKAYTRYPYILMIPQNVTERILEKKLASLGVVIHRPLRVVGLRSNAADPQISDITFENGQVITAKYVIGADGAHSVVRTTAGIGFSDPINLKSEADSNLAQMALADITLDAAYPEDVLQSATLSPTSFFLCFPLPPSYNESLATEGQAIIPDQVYRIGCGVPVEEGEIPHAPHKEYMQRLVDRFGPNRLSSDPSVNPSSKPTHIKQVIWSTRFRPRSAIADATFTRLRSEGHEEGGAILLIGDAAHIHSPVGGQGMNLGLRDATFLGEAVSKHICATETQPIPEADSILREFATARHARALEVINMTKNMLSVAGMKYRERVSWWCPFSSDMLRSWILWVLGSIPFVQRKMAWELSGLARR